MLGGKGERGTRVPYLSQPRRLQHWRLGVRQAQQAGPRDSEGKGSCPEPGVSRARVPAPPTAALVHTASRHPAGLAHQQGLGWELLGRQLTHDLRAKSHREVPPDGAGHPMPGDRKSVV